MPGWQNILSALNRNPRTQESAYAAPQAETPLQVRPPTRSSFSNLIQNTQHLEQPTPGLRYLAETLSNSIPENATAIDLGSGGGRDTRILAHQGWRVTAIDTAEAAGQALGSADPEKVDFKHGTLFDADVKPASIHLINAQRILPFLSPDVLDKTLSRSFELLTPDGHLSVSFFGPAHSWNGLHQDKTFHGDADIEQILARAGFTLAAKPKHRQGPQKAGNGEQVKNWHEILIIARKKKTASRHSNNATATALRSALT